MRLSHPRAVSLTLIIVAEVLAGSLWFAVTAIVPTLQLEAGVDDATASYFTSAVQLGFVIGALGFGLTGAADRFDARYIFSLAAAAGAAANLSILAVEPSSDAAILLRFATGLCLAGVYPVGMKLAVGWARGDVGLLVGLLVGALTLGTASPHLFVFLGDLNWRATLVAASACAAAGAVLILCAREGPMNRRAVGFRLSAALAYWSNKPIRYANFGYLGHMWELYAMWAWVGVFLAASFQQSMPAEAAARLSAAGTFGVVALGAVGAILAGVAADRVGRTLIASLSLAVSGGCCVAIGLLFGAAPWLVLAVGAVWGFAVAADSAQFSASVSELSEPDQVGTMLTLQTSVGFMLTLLTIHAIPHFVDWLGWRYAFAPLAIGPALGLVAMLRLRAMPESRKLAGGRR